MIVQVSQTIVQPTEEFDSGAVLQLRVWYTRDFVAGDGVTPVLGGNGRTAFYDVIDCSVNVSGWLVIPAFNVQATTESNPTAGFFGQLYVDDAARNIIFGGQAQSGWAIPTTYGSVIAFDELATYNRANRLVYPPITYFTANQTVQTAIRIAGQQNYAGVGILGRTQLDTAPAVTSVPIAVGINSPLLYTNTHLLPASNVLTPQLYGAFADGAAHLITSQDITNNPQWIGSYSVGDSWDYVAVQEAIYACFATHSVPGVVAWNAEHGHSTLDRPLYFPQGTYYINRQLTLVASGFDIYGSGRKATVLQWQGQAFNAMWYCNAVSYGTFGRMALTTAIVTSQALLELDWTGLHTSLATQQITLSDMDFDGNSMADYGVRISKSGTSAQGDTILLPNCLQLNCLKAGVALGFVNAQNALGVTIVGGDNQGNHKDGIAVTGGQVFVWGTSFQNQNTSESGTLATQITLGGADVHVYSTGGITAQSSMRDVRSESDVLSIGVSHIDHCALACATIDTWTANSSYQIGQLIRGTAGVGQKGAAGRTFMMVASAAGTAYITPDGSSTLATIIDPAAAYTANQWVGYGLTIRYLNGFIATAIIASNTATTISLVGALPFDYHPCAGQVCTAACGQPAQAFPCVQYRIGGISAGTEPVWNSVVSGYNGVGGAGLGGNITVSTTTLTSAFFGSTYPNIGDYVMVVDAGGSGTPLISRIAAVNTLHSVELEHVAGATVVDSQFYIGTPFADGTLRWIDIDYNAITDAGTVKAAYLNGGRFRGATTATIENCVWARPDWVRASEFEGGATGDNVRPSLIHSNTVGAGDIFSASVNYNLFQGTSGGYQQIAPYNMAGGMMLFDSGENNALLGEVGVGRGDGKSGLTPGTAEYITRNTLGVIGAVCPPAVTGVDQPNGDLILQGGISTGSGTAGSVSIRAAKASGSGSTPNSSAEIIKVDSTGLHLLVVAFANLVAAANGTVIFINDGTAGNPVTGGGTGCLAIRQNGVWVGLS